MLCARCNSENSDGSRYCNACGSPLSTPPSDQPGRAPGSALTPRAAKELDAPSPLAEFRQTAIQSDPASLPTEVVPHVKPDSISTQPRPLYVKPIPTTKPAPVSSPSVAPAAELWQWCLAIASAALFLYNSSIVMSIALFWRTNGRVSGLSTPFVVSLALAGAACCGIALGLPDAKTTITVIAGGILLRSLIGLLGRFAASLEWLLLCVLAGGVLWWIWLQSPRVRGDAGRMSLALTILVAADALSAGYAMAIHPSGVHARSLAIVAVSIGALLCLRIWLPGAVGDGTGRPLR